MLDKYETMVLLRLLDRSIWELEDTMNFYSLHPDENTEEWIRQDKIVVEEYNNIKRKLQEMIK